MTRNISATLQARFLRETERALNGAMSAIRDLTFTPSEIAWFKRPLGGGK